jgi:N-acetylneuraminate lyase
MKLEHTLMTGSALIGILPAVVTPFDEWGRFADAAFERLLHFVYEAGVDGVYVCGQTGEGLLQRTESRKRATELAVSHSPRGKTVIVHVGAHRLDDAVELAAHARRAGADAISSLPPSGNYSFAECKAYYEALASAADLPLLVYYFSEGNSSISTADQILELCAIPNVVGLKFTDHDLYKLHTVKRHGVTVFNGRDEVLVAGLLMGADGGIGTFYNLVPQWFVELYRLTKAEDWNGAQRVQTRINDLIRVVFRFPVFPAVKLILGWMGLESGRCVAPRRSLTEAEELQLRTLLEEKGLLEALLDAASAG